MAEEVSLKQLASTVAALDGRLAEIDRKLDRLQESITGLSLMTARAPDGRTLINLVLTILNEVD